MSLDPVERGRVSRRIWDLSREFRGEAVQPESYPYAIFKLAKREYDKVRARWMLEAPVKDPNDASRKMNADDREAWVESRPEVAAAADALAVAEIAWKYHDERSWDRKSELEALRTLSADMRAEMNAS